MNQRHLTSASGSAHGKIILMGEHAVVHGTAAIALPIPSISVTVDIFAKHQGPTELECSYYQGPLKQAPENLRNIQEVYHQVLQEWRICEVPVKLRIKSHIPHERGMGSSAAVVTALVRALATFYQQELPMTELHRYVNIGEEIAHGKTSGLDTIVTSSSQPVLFQRAEVPKSIHSQLDGCLLIADSGHTGNTRLAVESVCQRLKDTPDTQSYLSQIHDLVKGAVSALKDNQVETLGQLMNRNQEFLQKLGVSTPQLDHLIQVARHAGALGAKLTGAGLGGCIIALCPNQEIARHIQQALEAEGLQQSWFLNFNRYQSMEV